MVVVSSDHRVQRAARRRRAQAVDSDVWFAELVRRRANPDAPAAPAKPNAPLSAVEIEYWLGRFAAVEDQQDTATADAEELPPHNPFPPGYAEDVADQ
jgi:hypothetical protein